MLSTTCESDIHPECAWITSDVRKDSNGNYNGQNKYCADSSQILFTLAHGRGRRMTCNAMCIDMKDCIHFSMYNE